MKKYHIVYKSNIDGNCYTVWAYAKDEEDAVQVIQHEYYDVERIINVY